VSGDSPLGLFGGAILENVTGEVPPEEAPEPTGGEGGDAGSRGRNEDPRIPEVFRDTIPPPPRGWTEDAWRKSFLGEQESAPGRGLSFGKGWLLALVIGIVALVLVVLVIILH